MKWSEIEAEANNICDEQKAKGNLAWFERCTDIIHGKRFVRIYIDIVYEPND